MKTFSVALLAGALVLPFALNAASPLEKVTEDMKAFSTPSRWIYNDLEKGIEQAKLWNKPLMIIFRCVPCVACSQFDKRVLEQQNEITDLMDLFVCVRIIHGNGMDLSLFQFDYDQSFHTFFLHPDKTILGRFGTRSARKEDEDMTMEGLRKAMVGALDLHARFNEVKPSLAGKHGPAVAVAKPEEYPNLKDRYATTLATGTNVARSCIHCHQIRESDRMTYRNAGTAFPDSVLFPYPLPDVLGLKLDPKQHATVVAIEPGSIAAKSGLRAGDGIESLQGQPLLSIADLQWVLHRAGPKDTLAATVVRDGKPIQTRIELAEGWRRGNISWRATTWDLRRMATGGLLLEELPDNKRTALGLKADQLGLHVKHVGQYGEHAVAKRAGFLTGDVIVAIAGSRQRKTESELISSALSLRKGDSIEMTVRRGAETKTMTIRTQ